MGGSFLTSTLTDESHRWETPGAENWTAGESAAEERGYDVSSDSDMSWLGTLSNQVDNQRRWDKPTACLAQQPAE